MWENHTYFICQLWKSRSCRILPSPDRGLGSMQHDLDTQDGIVFSSRRISTAGLCLRSLSAYVNLGALFFLFNMHTVWTEKYCMQLLIFSRRKNFNSEGCYPESSIHNKMRQICRLLKCQLTVKTQIRLLPLEQSDLGPQCLPLY